MEQNKVFIISRRAWQQDDIEYGTFQPIYTTLNVKLATKLFNSFAKGIMFNDETDNFDIKDDFFFEYERKGWFYQYKLEEFVLEKLYAKLKDDNQVY